ncbi:hypothetical protein G9A89_001023 [Geosiphon pyriformis]|nr:hypothetical protein G9A89_001023 [Geosiphon pyriformis]
MFFNEALSGYRRSEPTQLLALRCGVTLLLLAIFSGYITILFLDIIFAGPILQISYENSDTLPLPALRFKYKQNFNISCYFSSDAGTDVNACNQYISKPTKDKDGTYIGFFKSGKDLTVSSSTLDQNGILGVTVMVDTNDQNAFKGVNIITVNAYDPGFDPFVEHPEIDDANFLKGLAGLNSYPIQYQQSNVLVFSRSIKEKLTTKSIGMLGLPLIDKQKIPFVRTLSVTGPMPTSPKTANYAAVSLWPRNFIVDIESEERSHTILGSLGLIGGAWILAIGIYTILFGSNALRPFGFIQSHCCGLARKTKQNLANISPILSFFQTSKNENEVKSLSGEKLTLHLQQRVSALELFLKEYVVNIEPLERVSTKFENRVVPVESINKPMERKIEYREEKAAPFSPISTFEEGKQFTAFRSRSPTENTDSGSDLDSSIYNEQACGIAFSDYTTDDALPQIIYGTNEHRPSLHLLPSDSLGETARVEYNMF